MLALKTTLTAAVATLGLVLGAPSESKAQSFGLSVNVGRGGFSYYQNSYPTYGYTNSYPTYGYTPPFYREVYPQCGTGVVAAPVVIPERYHWTPYRGWHTHGSVFVPHHDHVHRYRY